MFGADTKLMMDALQIAVIAAAVGGTLAYLYLRIRRKPKGSPMAKGAGSKTSLESRVEVLERIATDPTIKLSQDIEALRIGDLGGDTGGDTGGDRSRHNQREDA